MYIRKNMQHTYIYTFPYRKKYQGSLMDRTRHTWMSHGTGLFCVSKDHIRINQDIHKAPNPKLFTKK